MFPKLSDAKLRREIFVGSQTTTMFKSRILEEKMTETEKKFFEASLGLVEVF